MSYSWELQAVNGRNNRAKRSEAIIIPSPVINYARPNTDNGYGKFAGPADIWNPNKGFLVQSINPESYNLNFPTTGMNGLYFDLLISGVDINELTWAPVTHEGITATVTNVVANDDWIAYKERRKVVVRVKLTGPEARNQWKNPNPSPIAKPRLPQMFELVGRDVNTGDEVVKYGFVLKQWFVHRGGEWKNHRNQSAWCNGLGYRLPRVKDLTNTKCNSHHWFPCINASGANGASPLSSHSRFQRQIGAGFFTEWGECRYSGLGFYCGELWTSDIKDKYSGPFTAHSNGMVSSLIPSNGTYTVCTTP